MYIPKYQWQTALPLGCRRRLDELLDSKFNNDNRDAEVTLSRNELHSLLKSAAQEGLTGGLSLLQ